jgi:hypothetical protein
MVERFRFVFLLLAYGSFVRRECEEGRRLELVRTIPYPAVVEKELRIVKCVTT